jgi:hypothetical protein
MEQRMRFPLCVSAVPPLSLLPYRCALSYEEALQACVAFLHRWTSGRERMAEKH